MLNNNSRTVTLKLQRREVCDLLLALTLISHESDATKWAALHDKVKGILNTFDEKLESE